MEARLCFEFLHGLADISKFYPLPVEYAFVMEYIK
jgi:hypothetical protein